VSVGEVYAAGALVSALIAQQPAITVTLTTGNIEGRRAAKLLQQRNPQITAVSYIPWDRRAPLRRWLLRIQPDATIVVETEIWPNLFRAAHELSIPLLIVNGRIYPRDLPKYRLARPFFRSVLASGQWIGVQSEQERAAFLSIGAPADRIHVMGNLKHDLAPAPELDGPWRAVFEQACGEALIVGGSTHDPEEQWLIEALLHLRPEWPEAHLVLAPRHPRRAGTVRRLAEAAGLSAACWSDGATGGWDVLVLDRIGPLPAVYELADIAVIGGSLIDRGGHNPLEAANHGRAIIMGPSHENFRDAVAGLDQVAAIRLLPDEAKPAEALCSALLELARDPRQRQEMGRRALRFAAARRGVARVYAQALMAQLDAG
jgi:3-deoxy-D-manno-octulosonic-acid transferase